MKETGTILHVAKSGRVIIRLAGSAPHGDIVYDAKGARVARIREIIGPVSAPYASAEILTNNIKKYLGQSVLSKMEGARS